MKRKKGESEGTRKSQISPYIEESIGNIIIRKYKNLKYLQSFLEYCGIRDLIDFVSDESTRKSYRSKAAVAHRIVNYYETESLGPIYIESTKKMEPIEIEM